MWALPDLKVLNYNEVKNYRKLTRQLKNKKHKCDYCDSPATRIEPYYDIFSSIPKGISRLCDSHDEESLFQCETCGKLYVTHYTHELYHDYTQCLNCYRESYLKNPDNWISLTLKSIDTLPVSTITTAPHLLAVGQKTPKLLYFYKNIELDSFTGGRLTSRSTSEPSPKMALIELKEILTDLHLQGKKRAIVILDGAYQFSVSIGVYHD